MKKLKMKRNNGICDTTQIRPHGGIYAVFMFVSLHQADHVLNHEYLTTARIVHSVIALENVTSLYLLSYANSFFIFAIAKTQKLSTDGKKYITEKLQCIYFLSADEKKK